MLLLNLKFKIAELIIEPALPQTWHSATCWGIHPISETEINFDS